jgi:hypothetical protein
VTPSSSSAEAQQIQFAELAAREGEARRQAVSASSGRSFSRSLPAISRCSGNVAFASLGSVTHSCARISSFKASLRFAAPLQAQEKSSRRSVRRGSVLWTCGTLLARAIGEAIGREVTFVDVSSCHFRGCFTGAWSASVANRGPRGGLKRHVAILSQLLEGCLGGPS